MEPGFVARVRRGRRRLGGGDGRLLRFGHIHHRHTGRCGDEGRQADGRLFFRHELTRRRIAGVARRLPVTGTVVTAMTDAAVVVIAIHALFPLTLRRTRVRLAAALVRAILRLPILRLPILILPILILAVLVRPVLI